MHGDGPVKRRIGAGPVRAHQHEIAVGLIGGGQRAKCAGGALMVGGRDVAHHAGQGGGDVDGGILAALGQIAAEHDMAIEDRSRGIDDGVILRIAIGQHGVDAGDRAAALRRIARSLDDLGDGRQRRWRIAARRARLAQEQPDLASGMGDTGQRIHDQQHAAALGAKMLGHAGCQQGAANAQVWRVVGRDRDDGCGGAFGACHVAFDEIGDFARALANEADDDDFRRGAMGDHIEQHRFADARARHDADTLADAKGRQCVERTDAGIKGQTHRAAIQRARAHAACRPQGAGV